MSLSGKDKALAQRLQQIIEEKKEGNGAAISVALIQDHELLAACAVGVRGSDDSPAELDDLYNVGSVSKVYTAAAIMKLVDQGKVCLDDPVVNYLPRFRMRDPRYKDITVRMTLDHTSGLSGTNSLNMMLSEWDACGLEERDYRYWSDSVLKADPGEFSVYCNEGFELARLIIEKVSGMSFGAFLRKEILDPVGADSTGVEDERMEGAVLMRCKEADPEFIMAVGAGGVRTNLIDCARFGDLFLQPGLVLTKESIDEMSTPAGKTFIKEDTLSPVYGLGWDNVAFRHEAFDFGEGVMTKGGTTGQFGSFLLVSPAFNLCAAISVTSDTKVVNSELLCELIAEVLEQQGHQVKRERPSSKKPVPIPLDVAEEISGYYYSGIGVYRAEVTEDTLQLRYYGGKGKWETFKFFPDMKFDGELFEGEIYKVKLVKHGVVKYLLLYLFSSWMPILQSVETLEPLPKEWVKRLETKYFCVNLPARSADYFMFAAARFEDVAGDGVLSLVLQEGMPALPFVPDGADTSKMIWRVPGMGGRDLVAPYFFTKEGREYMTFFSFVYREATSFEEVTSGTVRSIHEGETLVFRTNEGMKLTFDLPEGVKMLLFSEELELLYEEKMKPEMPAIPDGYIVFASSDVMQFPILVE